MGLFGGNTAGNQAGMLSALGYASAMNASKDALTSANEKARNDLTANNYYQPYYDAGNNSLAMLQNSLGLNGDAGKSAALQAFQNYNPGYQFQMDQGLQALDRSAASRGMLGSGNNQMALMNYGQGLANQNYGNWQSKIGGLSQMGQQAAAGMTGQQNNLANLDNGLGTSLASIYMGGTNQAMNALQKGQMDDAAANAQGQKNLFGAIMGGLSLATGGLGGGGNLFSDNGGLAQMFGPKSGAIW